MDALLSGMRAAAEPTRLRLLAICAEGETTVSDLVRILGQSQPRVSRHLKLMCEAGLLERLPEGSWAFYRLADAATPGGQLARRLASLIPADDPQVALDRRRLGDANAARNAAADAYFRANAAQWDRIRSLHVDEAEVERALRAAMPDRVGTLVDVGTGTGRMLHLFADRVERGIGIDLSRDMLAVARANLAAAGLRHCQVRQGDMYRLPLADGAADAVIVHQVLHYADRPAGVIAEAARVLRPGGVLVIADFAPHAQESLRTEHAHRRLGFADREVAEWCREAGLDSVMPRHLPGDPLTVTVWRAERPETHSNIPAGLAASAAVPVAQQPQEVVS
jgi:ArsR family transcriptional regulator